MVKDKYKKICFRGASYSDRIWEPDRPGSNLSSTNYGWPSVYKDTKGQLWDFEHLWISISSVNPGTNPLWIPWLTRLTVISGKLFHLFNPDSSSAK